jgi:hypothetical protein
LLYAHGERSESTDALHQAAQEQPYSMFEEWKFERRLRMLQKEKKKDFEFYKSKIQATIKEHGEGSADGIVHEAKMERDILQEDIEELITRYVTDVAQQLLVPIPDQEAGKPDMWQRTSFAEKLVLTPLGVKVLRDGIHEEMKKRTERRFLWLTLTMFLSASSLIE